MVTTAEQSVSRILTENVCTLQQARMELYRTTGKRPDKSTIFRWVHRGINGVKLEHVRVGREILTSKQALNRFLVARTAAGN